MAEPLTFFVAGIPQTQGGMKEVTAKNGRKYLITTGSKDLKPWRAAVTNTAARASNVARWIVLHDCPVAVSLKFFLPMAKSERAYLRHFGIDYQFVQPDIDKMQRAILDSLTKAEVYADDGQVARVTLDKYRVADHTLCGVEVIVRPVAADYSDDGTLAHALLRRRSSMVRTLPSIGAGSRRSTQPRRSPTDQSA